MRSFGLWLFKAGVSNEADLPMSAHRFFRGYRFLQRNSAALFGPLPQGRSVHIMVTLAAELADDYFGAKALVAAGMRVARINCAKENPEIWRAMTANVRRAGRELGCPVKIAFDLCGPRARTEGVWAAENRRTRVGDRILMTAGEMTPADGFDFVVQTSLPETLPQLDIGSTVTIDEGTLRTTVTERRSEALVLEVVACGPRGIRVKPNKGLNFPGTSLQLDPLTAKDRRDLDAIAQQADLIGYSFVQSPDDVHRLQRELAERSPHPRSVGIVAKIETGLAIKNLPEIIVAGAGYGPFGVMIARGDLAVEIGYRRLAEIQEELLWLCEAAHVPVIWATEVMSSFVRTGQPTRSEMTDAAMAERAECVMLNKGPFLSEAVKELSDLLTAMQGHQQKKVSRLRALKSW